MDPSLLREREAFKKTFSKTTETVATIKQSAAKFQKDRDGGPSAKKKSYGASKKDQGPPSLSAKAKMDMAQLRQMGGGSSQYKFAVLSKIVRHMRHRHMEGEDQALNLEEVLDETNQLDVSNKIKLWLSTEALKSNPKIDARETGHVTQDYGPQYSYLFKPPYKITNKKMLVRLLQDYDRKGLGGVFLEDLQESLPRCDKVVSRLLDDNRILMINAADKKKVVFLRENAEKLQFQVDEEFQKLWRTIAVDSLDDMKIEEYLEKTGFAFMQDEAEKKKFIPKPKRKGGGGKRKNRGPRDNEHMKDILENYEDMSSTAADKTKK